MTPGVASVCAGTVYHRRATPTEHSFEYPMSMVWIDPDHPNDLCHHHRLYSPAEPAPARFRRSDYGDERTPPLGLLVRDDLEPVLGHRPDGPIRMLTQLRRFGWLFNPITVYLAWDTTDPEPVGAVLEVTNTPWHERHRYTIALHDAAPAGPGPRLIDLPEGNDAPIMRTARFPKSLHVSPFFGQDYDYLIRGRRRRAAAHRPPARRPDQRDRGPRHLSPARPHSGLSPCPGSQSVVGPLSTYRVSTGIHSQAARLAAKRVPFVRHPDKLTQESPS
ncbi:MAG: DUF1365 family protein [Acidimicrobiales bacterium]